VGPVEQFAAVGGSVGAVSSLGPVFLLEGFPAQIAAPDSLVVTATPAIVGEGQARQLAGALLLDDGTTVAIQATAIQWQVLGGPLTAINGNGVAQAAVVYQDTASTAGGSAAGVDGNAQLTIINVDPDNFGAYAGDGLDDLWQVTFFGINNPDAGPGKDPDGDKQDNTFEFRGGTVPDDPTSFFKHWIVAAPAGEFWLRFEPWFADRVYTFEETFNLSSFQLVPGATIDNAGAIGTAKDPAAGPAPRFYKIGISKP